jgi:carbamoyl-phosphate synthase small subunit
MEYIILQILNQLKSLDCELHIFPWNIDANTLLNSGFDAILLSNGPGDPKDVIETISAAKKLIGKIPLYGICLGHQLMGLATGAKTAKLKYGHRGPNQPVKDIKLDRVHITSQNHGYYILEETVDKNIAEVSHVNINDGTVEGLRYKNKDILTVQFHPEACPGPKDSEYLFDDFIETVKERKNRRKINAKK